MNANENTKTAATSTETSFVVKDMPTPGDVAKMFAAYGTSSTKPSENVGRIHAAGAEAFQR